MCIIINVQNYSHFWIDFYKCYTKTFGIVYILIGYLLIMLLWVIFICTYFLCFLSVYNWAIVAIWSLLFVNKYTPLVGVY